MLLALLAALGWGAMHAMSPGHGKTLVAAYLVGAHGTARHALFLGLTTTITHTAGVFALGFVTLALSRYILPEHLYPWLSAASGILVVLIGLSLVRSRLRGAGHDHPHDHDHEHGQTMDHIPRAMVTTSRARHTVMITVTITIMATITGTSHLPPGSTAGR